MGKEANPESMFLTLTTVNDYENHCRMDVLGLADSPCKDQSAVHSEFLEQLERSPEEWYQTHLPWKGNHPPLTSNEQGNLRRLKTRFFECCITPPRRNRDFPRPNSALVKRNVQTCCGSWFSSQSKCNASLSSGWILT